MNSSKCTHNWTPFPDRLTEDEVRLELNWTAVHPGLRSKREARLMGFESPTAYLLQALAVVIAGNEEDPC